MVMADDLNRGDAAKFAKHTSEFFSQFASELSREKMVDRILTLRPMMYAVLHGHPMLVDTVLKQLPELDRNGTFERPNFNNQFNKHIPEFPREFEGKTYRGVADIVIKTSGDPAKVERYKQIKKLLLRSGAKPKTHLGKLVFPEDKEDVDYYSKGGRKAKKTYKRKVSARRSTRRRLKV